MAEPLAHRPSPEQLLLLHAALDEPQVASRSWERWQASVGIDRADGPSQHLLPLIYRRELHRFLGLTGGGEVAAGRERQLLREAYRAVWVGNRILFARVAPAIAALGRAGIETLVIKGASLALLSYRDIGVRSMDDVDVLVPFGQAHEAIDVLLGEDWTPSHDDPHSRVQAHHSLGFAGPGRGEIDLHWFALWQPADDEPLWRASVPMELAGARTRGPCPVDQLLLACVHGAPWSRVPSLRWIADAMTILWARGERLDWDRFTTEAARRRLTVATSATLAYLRGELGAPVPEPVLNRLDAKPVPRHERVAFRASCQPDSPRRTLQMAWDRYRRLRELDTATPTSFVAFARRFWDLESAWQLPRHASASRLRRRKRDTTP